MKWFVLCDIDYNEQNLPDGNQLPKSEIGKLTHKPNVGQRVSVAYMYINIQRYKNLSVTIKIKNDTRKLDFNFRYRNQKSATNCILS